MEENDIVITLTGLRKLKQQAEEEISKWQIKVSGLNTSIDLCESMLPKHFATQNTAPSIPIPSENSDETPASENQLDLALYSDFPRHRSSKEQALYLLEKTGRAVRMPFLQIAYSKLVGSTTTAIRHPYNRLKEDGRVVVAKFNGNFQQVFYGLSEWVETDENGKSTFKEQYRPSETDLPFGYDTIDFVYQA